MTDEREAVPDAPGPEQHRVVEVLALRPARLARVEEEREGESRALGLPARGEDLLREVERAVRAVFLLDEVEARDAAGVALALREGPVEHALHLSRSFPRPAAGMNLTAKSASRSEPPGPRRLVHRPAPELDVLHVLVDQAVEHPSPVAGADLLVVEEAPPPAEAVAELLPDVGRLAVLLPRVIDR